MAKFGLPAISSNLPADVRQFFERMREFVASSANNVTVTQLVSAGVVSTDAYGNIYSGTAGAVDLTPPPAIIGFTATGAMTTIMLTWTNPGYNNLSFVEIYRADTNNLGAAVHLGVTTGDMYADAVTEGTSHYYWVRIWSNAGVAGPWNAVAGTLGQTAQNPTYLLNTLSGLITASQLHTSLGSRINLIDTAGTGLVDRATSLEARATAIEAVNAGQLSAINALNTASNEWSWATLDALAQLNTANNALLHERGISDATVVIDPTTGQIRLNAFVQINNGTNRTLNDVNTIMDGNTATIASHASTISSQGTRLTTAESTISQHAGEIALRATTSYVDGQISNVASALIAAVTPVHDWAFSGVDEGFVGNVTTITPGTSAATLTATGTNPYVSKTGLSYSGNNDVIYVRVKRTGGTGFEGAVRYSTAGHGFDDVHVVYCATTSVPADTNFHVLVFNMQSAGADYTAGTITGLRIDLGLGAGDNFELDAVQVSKLSMYQLLQQGIDLRVSSAETRLSSAEATIASHTSYLQVGGAYVSMTTVDSRLSAAEGAIALKAAQTALDTTNANVTSVTGRASALEINVGTSTDTPNITGSTLWSRIKGTQGSLETSQTTISQQGGQIALKAASSYVDQQVNLAAENALQSLLTADSFNRSHFKDLGNLATAEQTVNTATSAVEAEASARLALAAEVASNYATMVNSYSTKANVNSVTATAQTSLYAQFVNSSSRSYRGPAAPTQLTTIITLANGSTVAVKKLNTGDLWIDTGAAIEEIYSWTTPTPDPDGGTAGWVLTTINTATAWSNHYTNIRAAADGAVVTSVSTLAARLNTGDFAAVKQESSANASAINGLSAQWTVKLDVGGKVAGFGLASSSPLAGAGTSTFEIRADKIAFAAPSGGTAASIMPFVVDTVNNLVVMDGAYIKNATINNAKIANLAVDDAKVASVSANKLTAGSIAVNEHIQSSNYAAGSAGWRVNGDGSAEFSNIYARGNIRATSFSAITLAAGEHIKYGSTAYNTGNGFFLGDNGAGVPVFSLKSATNGLTWDGTSLSINGGGTFSGGLSAATGSFGDVTATGAVTVSNTGNIKGGAATYADPVSAGFFLGYHGAAYKFSVGSNSSYVRWDGVDLRLAGKVVEKKDVGDTVFLTTTTNTTRNTPIVDPVVYSTPTKVKECALHNSTGSIRVKYAALFGARTAGPGALDVYIVTYITRNGVLYGSYQYQWSTVQMTPPFLNAPYASGSHQFPEVVVDVTGCDVGDTLAVYVQSRVSAQFQVADVGVNAFSLCYAPPLVDVITVV